MELIFTILGTTITLIGIIYAIYSNRKYFELVNYNKDISWEIYRQTSIALQTIQEIKEVSNKNENDKYILYEREEATLQELILNSMKMIKRFEKNFDEIKLNKLFELGKISNESHLSAFKKYIDLK